MATGEALVDLSLFSYSPTDDYQFSVHEPHDSQGEPRVFHQPSQPVREFYAPVARHEESLEQVTSKPLPRLPPRRICGGIQIPREYESGCVLNRMKRKRTNESPGTAGLSLPRRRNIQSPPQLTLSVPGHSVNNQGPSSELVWMPEEQMWLIIGEGERGAAQGPQRHHNTQAPVQQQNRCRSEPATRAQSRWHVTPPMSPIQTQLQSLIQQPRDEERLSPLFQEAMNSVPMEDLFDSPPAYDGAFGNRFTINTSTLSPTPRRSASDGATRALAPSISSCSSQRPSLGRAVSFGSNYTTAHSHLSPSETSSMLSRSHTDRASRPPLKPVTSKYGIWTPNVSSNYTTHIWSPNASGSSRKKSTSNDVGTGGMMDFLQQDPDVGKSKSWHGFARKFTRPKSAT